GAFVTSINSGTPTALGDFTTPQTLSATNSFFALRSNSSIASSSNANQLKITAVGLTAPAGQGGILLYGTGAAPTIGANVTFDPSTAAGGGLAEGVVYVRNDFTSG